MKLLFTHTSPFARKCRIAAIEVGLEAHVQVVMASPADASGEVNKANPLGKIPALIRDDGSTLYDSRVICEFLDDFGHGSLFPPKGEARWQALRRQSLADGIMDAAVLRRYEQLRPEAMRSKDWSERQRGKVERALNALETEDLPTDMDIGALTIVVALDYLDFRFAAEDWRVGRERLTQWHGAMARRPAFHATTPKE